jgi:multimeric flavodoxin WrbA
MRLVLQGVAGCDRIVLASPVYFGTVSAQFKTMIDRLQPLWVRKYRLNDPLFRKEDGRAAVFICAGATNTVKYFEAAEAVAKIALSVMNVEHRGSVFAMGADAAGDVERDHQVMNAAFAAGIGLISR